MCSQPYNYNNLFMLISNFASNTTLVFDEVVGKIINEDMRRKSMGKKFNHETYD